MLWMLPTPTVAGGAEDTVRSVLANVALLPVDVYSESDWMYPLP